MTAIQAAGADSADFIRLNHILEEERAKSHVSKMGRAAFRFLELVAYALPVVISLAFIGDRLAATDPNWLAGTAGRRLDVATAVTRALILPLVVALIVLMVANGPLLRKAYRQWRLSRRVAALRLLDDARIQGVRTRWRPGAKSLFLLAPLALLSLLLANLPRFVMERGRSAGGAWAWEVASALAALAMVVFLPVALLIADQVMRRLRARLAYLREVESVRSALLATERGERAVTDALSQRLADVERARILRNSAQALTAAASDHGTAFGLRKTEDVVDRLNELDSTARMAIEQALERLVQTGEQLAARQVAGEAFEVHTSRGRWRIEYRVTLATRTIEVVALTASSDFGS